jgi:hypothetical protein
MTSDVIKKTEDCFVAFVDILGFTNQVKEADGNYEDLAEQLNLISRTGDVFKELFQKLNYIVVSDSIVISIPVDAVGTQTLAALVNLLANIQYNFFDRYRILMRGGLAIGRMYHDENIFLGEAYLAAYKLESTVAKYPRIIISKDVVSYAKENNIEDIRYDKYSFNDFCLEDTCWDSLFFIDYKGYGIKVWDNNLKVHDWGNKLQSGTNSYKRNQKIKDDMTHSDPKIAEKNRWLNDYIYPEFASVTYDSPVSIKNKIESIRRYWNMFFESEKYFKDKINFNDEVKTGYIKDVTGNLNDTADCINEFKEKCGIGTRENLSTVVLLQTGFLQSLYIQQDLIDEMLGVFKLEKSSSVEKEVVRNLRNCSIGHPISRNKKENNKLESSIFWCMNDNISVIKFKEYPKGHFDKGEVKEHNIYDLLDKHDKYMNMYLDKIVKKIFSIKKKYYDEIRRLLSLSNDDLIKRIDAFENIFFTSFDSNDSSYQYEYLRHAVANKKQPIDKYEFYIALCMTRTRARFQENLSSKVDYGKITTVPESFVVSMQCLENMDEETLYRLKSLRTMVNNFVEWYIEPDNLVDNSETLIKMLEDMERAYEDDNKSEFYISYVMLENELIKFHVELLKSFAYRSV